MTDAEIARLTGLVIHHDPKNESFLLADSLPKPKGVTKTGEADFKPKTTSHRLYRWFEQDGPKCTGFSSITLLATAHPYNRIPLASESPNEQRAFTGDDWYDLNVAFDRSRDRYFDGGATVTASMEIGRRLGFFSEYRWAYTMRVMQQAIEKAPLIAGTYWYPSMFNREVPKATDSAGDLGHQYVLNRYDAKRDLWRVAQTWGDGYWYIPGDLMYRLVREEGEIAQITEIKLPKKLSVVSLAPADVQTLIAA
jgi:hypothetical protein